MRSVATLMGGAPARKQRPPISVSQETGRAIPYRTGSVRRALPPEIEMDGPLGVTIASPGYQHLVDEAVRRFRVHTGLKVLVLSLCEEPAFASKLYLDQFVVPRPIIYFDVDLWMLRAFDFEPLCGSGRWCAVPDPATWNPLAFPCTDCEREGWVKEDYFNSGLFVCDLADPRIRRVFADARAKLSDCHSGRSATPADWTDQYFLNWAVQQQPGLLRRLPFAMNFYKKAVDWGSYPHIPREIIGLHAAGVMVEDKQDTLIREASVFGEVTEAVPRGSAKTGNGYMTG